MARGIPLKDPLKEQHLFRVRAITAGGFTAVLVAALLARLTWLQVFSHEHFGTLSHNNRVAIQPIAPTRGLIFDRNGVILAENLPTFSLEIVPERVTDMNATLAAIDELIAVSESDVERFRDNLKRKRRFEAIPLRFRLSDEEVARISVNRHRLPGVEINSVLTRRYPLGALTAHTVGYVGHISEEELKELDASNYSATTRIGKTGVERSHEAQLHGEVGFQQVETNARGRVLRVLSRTPPVPGRNLYLNIDVRLQRAAEAALGEEHGAVVAIEPRSGAVLALVSIPAYDPNLFVDGIPREDYRILSTSRDQPLFNRALRGQYPPGSTIKPIIGLAGLESGQIKHDHRVFCPGWYQLPGDERRYRDWKRDGHGWTDLRKAVVESCDVFFYDLALNLGIDRLSSFMHQFGFGLPTGIDIGGEASGLMPSREWKRRAKNQPWFPGETLITGIGQGFTLTTPVQLAATTAALSVEGRRYRPQVVRAIEDPAGGEVVVQKPLSLPSVPVVNRGNWQHIVEDMAQVVHGLRGTARGISRNLTYRIAAKTGTAQVFGIKQDEEYVAEEIEKRLRDHALFVGFAPTDAPRIAVAVIVENGGSGGAVAGPIARAVFDGYLTGNTPSGETVHVGH